MRNSRFNKSGRVAALVVAMVLGFASSAMAGSGRGGVFNLGVVNTVNGYVTMLKGAYAGAMLAVTNTATEPTASAMSAVNNSAAATVRARNIGSGPAFQAIVPAGRPPMRISAGAGKVAHLNVDLLDGRTSGDFQRRVSGACPAGSSIGSIAANGTVSCVGKAGDADLLDGRSADDFQGSYERILVVSPVGTDAENGAALRAAFDGLSASASQPMLLKLEPGTYDLGTDPLVMKQYVDVEGSGPRLSVITCACGGTNFATTDPNHTVKGATGADLRFLGVENTGGNSMSIAIYNNNVTAEMAFVEASASGATNSNTGVANYGGAVTMTNMSVRSVGRPSSTGVYNMSNAATVMDDVVVTSVTTAPPEGSIEATGISSGVTNQSSPDTRMVNVVVRSTGHGQAHAVRNVHQANVTMRGVDATAQGASDNTGVYNDGASPRMIGVVARGLGGTGSAGVRNISSTSLYPSAPVLNGVAAIASGSTGNRYGIYNDANGVGTAVAPVLMNVEAIGEGGEAAYGMRSFGAANSTAGASAQVSGSRLVARNATTSNDALAVSGTGKTSVVASSIAISGPGRSVFGLSGSTTQIRTSSLVGDVMNNGTMTFDASQVDNTVGNVGTMRIGGSMIGGVTAGGTYTCVASYTTTYTPLTCP